MAVTRNIGQRLNPVSSSVTGGLIPSANVIVKIDSWADALEPRRTPILTRCKTGKAVDLQKFEWGQNYHIPLTGTLGASLNNSATTVTLSAGTFPVGNGASLQKYHVLEIIDYVAGTTRLDYSTRELVLLTDDPDGSTTLTNVKRGFGTSAVAHNDKAYWGIVGVAMPYNTDFTMSPIIRGDRIYNVPQRFFGMVGADVAARNTPQYGIEGDPMLFDMKETTLNLKHLLERSLVSGQRYESTNAGTEPSAFGGIDYFVTNHSGRVNDLGGRTLSAYDLEDILRDMYKEIDDGGAKTMIMGPDTASIFDSLLNPIRQATVTDSSVNLVVDSVKFRWGQLEIMPTQHLPEGQILFVDFADISVHPYKGCAWSTKTLSTDGPYDKMAIWGDYTVKVDKPQRMGKIMNFNTDLSAYPRKEFF